MTVYLCQQLLYKAENMNGRRNIFTDFFIITEFADVTILTVTPTSLFKIVDIVDCEEMLICLPC